MKKAEITVQLIDYMGSDVSVVNAARISFDKIKDEFDEQDERLVNYLAEHNHWSPFAHTSIQVRAKAPFALARQLGKHQVGLVWNEVSRRYVSSEPEFWFPEEVHRAPVNAKQGAGNVHEWSGSAVGSMVNSTRDTLGLYENLIISGVAPEEARLVLPMNTMTEWVWTGSVMAFARVYNQRRTKDAQGFANEFAEKLAECIKECYPVCWKVLTKE